MKKLLIALIVMLIAVPAMAADLAWDDPGAEFDIITGYTIYFTDGAEQYNKTVYKPDINRADGSVTYADVEDNLNLAHNVQYSIYITAFNDDGESGPSNTVQYTRTGYVPPTDRLPPTVASSPSVAGGLAIN